MPSDNKPPRDSDLDPPRREPAPVEKAAADEDTVDPFAGIGQSQFELKKQQLQAEKARAAAGGTVGKLKRKLTDRPSPSDEPPKKTSGRLIDRPPMSPSSPNSAPAAAALPADAAAPEPVMATPVAPAAGVSEATIAALRYVMRAVWYYNAGDPCHFAVSSKHIQAVNDESAPAAQEAKNVCTVTS